EQTCKIPDLVDLQLLEGGAMLDRQDPALERKPRRERRDRDEPVLLEDDATVLAPLLPNDVAPHTALFHLPVARGARELLGHHDRNDRRRDQLGMRVLEGGSGCLSVVLEHEHVLEPWILLEIDDAVT